MSKGPWHKRYHSDALTGFRGLSLEQRGAYQTFLDLLYDSAEDALIESDRWFAGQMDCSVRMWISIRDVLIERGKILALQGGGLTNLRYRKEREKALEISRKRAENGAKGGDKSGEVRRKAAETRDENEANASGLPLYVRATPDTRSQKPDSTPPIVPPVAEAGFSSIERLAARAGVAAGLDVGPHQKTWGDTLDQVREWEKLGLDPDTEIIPMIEQDAVDSTERRWSLKYFTPGLRRLSAAKAARTNGKQPQADRRGGGKGIEEDGFASAIREFQNRETPDRKAQDGS